MKDEPNREEVIFNSAVRVTSAEEREAYLKEACHGDDQLRQRVEAHLRDGAKRDVRRLDLIAAQFRREPRQSRIQIDVQSFAGFPGSGAVG